MRLNFIKTILLLISVPFIMAPACGSFDTFISNLKKPNRSRVVKPQPKPYFMFKSDTVEVINTSTLKNKLRLKYLVTLTKGSEVKKPDSWTNLIIIKFAQEKEFNNHLKFDVIDDNKLIFKSRYVKGTAGHPPYVSTYFTTPAANNCSGTMRCSKAVVCDAKNNICKKEIIVDLYVDMNGFKDKLPSENINLQYMVSSRTPTKYKGALLSVAKLKGAE